MAGRGEGTAPTAERQGQKRPGWNYLTLGDNLRTTVDCAPSCSRVCLEPTPTPMRSRDRLLSFRSLLLAVYLGLSTAASAALQLAGLFTDGAVLQRDKPVPIWGWAIPAAEVRVTFHGSEVAANAGPDGKWQVELPAMPAEAKGTVLIVRAGQEKIEVKDVLVGEVWLCSGQSNMEWMVSQVTNAEQEVAAAKFPLIRQFRVLKEPAERPRNQVKGTWQPALPDKVGQFTGVGYFFARDIHQALQGVPVGIINAS